MSWKQNYFGIAFNHRYFLQKQFPVYPLRSKSIRPVTNCMHSNCGLLVLKYSTIYCSVKLSETNNGIAQLVADSVHNWNILRWPKYEKYLTPQAFNLLFGVLHLLFSVFYPFVFLSLVSNCAHIVSSSF